MAARAPSSLWGSLQEMHYHAIAPNFTSAQMLTVEGDRCLLHAARAISATESAHYWIVGGTEDYDEQDLEEAIAFDWRLYTEDLPIISAIEPPELPLDPNADVNTLADRFTLAYRAAFRDYVDRALSTRSLAAVFGDEVRLDLRHQLRLAARVRVDRPGAGRVVIVLGVADLADDRLVGLCFQRVGQGVAVDAVGFPDHVEDQLPGRIGASRPLETSVSTPARLSFSNSFAVSSLVGS